jgi:hypothetical protein
VEGEALAKQGFLSAHMTRPMNKLKVGGKHPLQRRQKKGLQATADDAAHP